MRFKDAFNQIVKGPIENLEKQLWMGAAYRKLDAYLEREGRIYQQLSKKRMENALETSEILGSKSDCEECEIEYGSNSCFSSLRRNELRQIGLFEFLKKYPEYREIFFPSRTGTVNVIANYRDKKTQQYLQRELN
jgi:hypothetical protein